MFVTIHEILLEIPDCKLFKVNPVGFFSRLHMSNMGYTYMVLILGSDSPDSLSLFWECDSLSLNCVQEESNVTFGWTVPLKSLHSVKQLFLQYKYMPISISCIEHIIYTGHASSWQNSYWLIRFKRKATKTFLSQDNPQHEAVLKTRGLLEVCRLLMKCFDVFAMNVSSTVVSLKRKRITIKIS